MGFYYDDTIGEKMPNILNINQVEFVDECLLNLLTVIESYTLKMYAFTKLKDLLAHKRKNKET